MTTSAPTVVLVHGAFADASSFARVIPELLADGLEVLAPAVPNRSLHGDAAYIASIVRRISGPVILVGHSYGGAVITVAGVEDTSGPWSTWPDTPWRRGRAWASCRAGSPTRSWPRRSSSRPSRSRARPSPALM
ncbi:esterase/lipase family protein [Streptomyces sp. NPDC002540]